MKKIISNVYPKIISMENKISRIDFKLRGLLGSGGVVPK